jgi:hypothetical protein
MLTPGQWMKINPIYQHFEEKDCSDKGGESAIEGPSWGHWVSFPLGHSMPPLWEDGTPDVPCLHWKYHSIFYAIFT